MKASQLRKFDERAAKAGEDLWGAAVLIGGIEYPAQVVEPQVQRAFVEAGMTIDEGAELVVRIRKCNLPEKPADGAKLVHKGTEWKVRSVVANAVDAAWTMRCEPKN